MSAEKSSKLQPVEVVAERVDDASTSAVSVVTPDGYRIEGLDRGEVASMLELLRSSVGRWRLLRRHWLSRL